MSSEYCRGKDERNGGAEIEGSHDSWRGVIDEG